MDAMARAEPSQSAAGPCARPARAAAAGAADRSRRWLSRRQARSARSHPGGGQHSRIPRAGRLCAARRALFGADLAGAAAAGCVVLATAPSLLPCRPAFHRDVCVRHGAELVAGTARLFRRLRAVARALRVVRAAAARSATRRVARTVRPLDVGCSRAGPARHASPAHARWRYQLSTVARHLSRSRQALRACAGGGAGRARQRSLHQLSFRVQRDSGQLHLDPAARTGTGVGRVIDGRHGR